MYRKRKKTKKEKTKQKNWKKNQKKEKKKMNKRSSELILFIKYGQYFVARGIRVLIIMMLWFVVRCSIVVGY